MRAEPFANTFHGELTVEHAAWRALMLWVTMLVVCLVALAATIVTSWPRLGNLEPVRYDYWFFASVVFYAVVVPIGAWWNRAIFRKHWAEGVVTPYGYLLGSAVLWGSFTLCTIWAAMASAAGGSFWPHMMLGFLGVVLMLGTWPSGRNMVNPRPRDEQDDDDIFHMTPQEEDAKEQPPAPREPRG